MESSILPEIPFQIRDLFTRHPIGLFRWLEAPVQGIPSDDPKKQSKRSEDAIVQDCHDNMRNDNANRNAYNSEGNIEWTEDRWHEESRCAAEEPKAP
jgi:hypothetical protein